MMEDVEATCCFPPPRLLRNFAILNVENTYWFSNVYRIWFKISGKWFCGFLFSKFFRL